MTSKFKFVENFGKIEKSYEQSTTVNAILLDVWIETFYCYFTCSINILFLWQKKTNESKHWCEQASKSICTLFARFQKQEHIPTTTTMLHVQSELNYTDHFLALELERIRMEHMFRRLLVIWLFWNKTKHVSMKKGNACWVSVLKNMFF